MHVNYKLVRMLFFDLIFTVIYMFALYLENYCNISTPGHIRV